jgi:hypothetical protein
MYASRTILLGCQAQVVLFGVYTGLGIYPPRVGILPSGLVKSCGIILGVDQSENIRRSARTRLAGAGAHMNPSGSWPGHV